MSRGGWGVRSARVAPRGGGVKGMHPAFKVLGEKTVVLLNSVPSHTVTEALGQNTGLLRCTRFKATLTPVYPFLGSHSKETLHPNARAA